MAAPALHGAAVVLPNSASSSEGASGLNTALQNGARTMQFQVAASQLSGVAVGSVFNGISFRLDSSAATSPSSSYSYTQYKITLAEAANTIASMSTTFANNMVSPVSVYNAPLTISASSYPGGSSPNGWGTTITFGTPYEYQGGDLVVLLSHPAASGGGGMDLDAAVATSEFKSMRSSTFDAATATTTDAVFTVFRLEYSAAAVPEPTEIALVAGTALLALAGWRSARR